MRAQTSQPVHEILATRRSPRSLNENTEVTSQELLSILEAGRWAPSAMNGQPWRYLVGSRGDETFNQIISSLSEGNISWAKNASVLILVAAEATRPDGSIHADYQYDCGLSVAQMVFQTHDLGFVAHQMTGFSKEKAQEALSLSTAYVPVVVLAIGKQDVPEKLTGPLLEREIAPRTRKPLSEIVLRGLPL